MRKTTRAEYSRGIWGELKLIRPELALESHYLGEILAREVRFPQSKVFYSTLKTTWLILKRNLI